MREAEAWSWIMKAALELQTSFRSWNDFAQDFHLGYQFWCPFEQQAEDPSWAKASEWLLNNPESPWVQIA